MLLKSTRLLSFFPHAWRCGCLTLLTACLTLAWGISGAQGTTLTRWEFDPTTNQAIFTLEEAVTPEFFLLNDPPRIVVDFPDTQVADIVTQQSYPGIVSEVRVSQFSEETARIVLELAPGTLLAVEQIELSRLPGNRWLLRPQLTTPSPQATLPLPPAQPPLTQTETTVTVPALPRPNAPSSPPAGIQTPIIEFGQPLPTPGNSEVDARTETSKGIIR